MLREGGKKERERHEGVRKEGGEKREHGEAREIEVRAIAKRRRQERALAPAQQMDQHSAVRARAMRRGAGAHQPPERAGPSALYGPCDFFWPLLSFSTRSSGPSQCSYSTMCVPGRTKIDRICEGRENEGEVER